MLVELESRITNIVVVVRCELVLVLVLVLVWVRSVIILHVFVGMVGIQEVVEEGVARGTKRHGRRGEENFEVEKINYKIL